MTWSTVGNIRGPQGPQGVQGPQGATGPAGVSGVTLKGAWSNSTAYSTNDVVTWGGSSYAATANKTAGSAPPTGTAADPGTDDNAVNAGWAVFAVQGAQGAQGPAGATGATGSQGPAGAQGIQGPQGATGAAGGTGPTGVRGSQWYTGTGVPPVLPGQLPGDMYLDTASGSVYTFS